MVRENSVIGPLYGSTLGLCSIRYQWLCRRNWRQYLHTVFTVAVLRYLQRCFLEPVAKCSVGPSLYQCTHNVCLAKLRCYVQWGGAILIQNVHTGTAIKEQMDNRSVSPTSGQKQRWFPRVCLHSWVIICSVQAQQR